MIENPITAWFGIGSLVVAGSLFAASFLLWLHERDIRILRPLTGFIRRPWFEVAVLLLFVGGMVQYGSTKGFLSAPSIAMLSPMASVQLPTATGDAGGTEGAQFPAYTNAVTNVCFTGIRPASTSVYLRAAWPTDTTLPGNALEVYASHDIANENGWEGVGTASVGAADGSVVIELPHSWLPGGWANSMFFVPGLLTDTDRDGLSDTFESLVSHTDPNLADSDGDGLPDGWEWSMGLDPLSGTGDDGAAADPDGDGLGNLEEYRYGTHPAKSDTDGDGLPDKLEIGQVEELRGEDFLWLDTTEHENVLGSESSCDFARKKISLPFGVPVNGVCHTNAQMDLDGLVSLIHPDKQTASIGSGIPSSGGMSNRLWSASHVTIAAYNTDIRARPRAGDWGSAFTHGTVTTNGATYSVVEYRDVSQYYLGTDTAARMTLQVILPVNETNVVYVSYMNVDEEISSINRAQNFGVQLPSTNCVPWRGRYANVSWNKYAGCFDTPLTLKYTLGTGTNPSAADADGDGLSDPAEVFVYHTDPYCADTDGDGLDDGREIELGTGANCIDTDGDGMDDGWEVENRTNPLVDDAAGDPDRDGLPNLWEMHNDTDPHDADADADMLEDGVECGWIEDGVTNVPWFTVQPILVYAPTNDVDRALVSCEMPFTNRLADCLIDTALADVNGVVYFGRHDATNSLYSIDNGQNLSEKQSLLVATVAAYWTDLKMRPAQGSSIIFGTATQNATNRFFVVEYRDVGTCSGSDNRISLQMSIPENEPNLVYVRYGAISDSRTSNRVSIGAQGAKVGNFASTPLLNHYYENKPPAVAEGQTLAFRFGAGSDPLKADTDGDGLDDSVEHIIGTNPRKCDTDGDGFTDKQEVEYGMNPCSAIGRDGADGDFDGDGLINRQELIAGTDPSVVDTDGDGLSDLEEVGLLSLMSGQEWIDFDAEEGVDITDRFINPDTSLVNYGLENDMRIQGESITNVIVDLNGVIYFPRTGHGNDIYSSGGRNLDGAIYPNALVVAPYWCDLYITTNAPSTKISVFETGSGTNGMFVLQYENACPYSNRNRTSVTNSISFQVVVERGGAGAVHVVYKDLIGASMSGQNARIGFQPIGGLCSHKFSPSQFYSSGSSDFSVFNISGQLGDGIGISYQIGFGTNPLSADSDGDGLTDGHEASIGTGPMAPDSDGDGLQDGWEQAHGLNPSDPNGDNGASGDPDGDGVSNSVEQDSNTDPHNADTDGDGMGDGIELQQGTDPLDESDRMKEQWIVLTGDLPKEELAEATTTVTIPARYKCIVAVFAASEEYPSYTGKASEYNDALHWRVSANGCKTMTNTIRVNDEDGAWSEAELKGISVCGFAPVVLEDYAVYESGETPLPVTAVLRAVNIKDGALPSSVIVGVFPFEVAQENMPTEVGQNGTTDAGTSYYRAILGTNSVAYITGIPSAPRIIAQFKGLPNWIDVAWSGSISTERSERGTLDNRSLPSETLGGNSPYSVTDALSNEIIGGKVSLRAAVSGIGTIDHSFSIRGKNPLDANARQYIQSCVDGEFSSYAWMIVKHESLASSRVYNQFNPSGSKKELPNKTTGNYYGWGMAQIDRGLSGGTTAEVYDWHQNIASMNTVLRDKRNRYLEIVNLYRQVYQNDTSTRWFEPDNVTTNVNGTVMSARQWTIMTLYNGARGTHSMAVVGRPNESTPIHFDPATTNWVLYTNVNDYVPVVLRDSTVMEVE